MLENRKIKLWVFLSAVFLFAAAVAALLCFEKQFCMDVPVISESRLSGYTGDESLDITHLRFNGKKVAADIAGNTLYISQAPDKVFHYSALQGKLDSAKPSQMLYFVNTPVLEDVASAVQSGTPLSLAVVDGGQCRRVNVVVTTLPVINIDGAESHKNEEGRAVFSGDATLWAGLDPATEAYSTTAGRLQWHVRGNATAAEPKKPWKLSFKNSSGENQNVSLLGLGEDDDWILNCLTMDDTRIKEKLFMDLWNTIAAQTDYNYKMSAGEYVELVINGEYLGLFLLQRRLDTKYLELAPEDVLLKVTRYQAATVEEAYEFVTPEVNTEQIYAIMQGVFDRTDSSAYNLHNVIDVNLMLQMANARDNYSLKNMYHVLRKTEQGFDHFLVPWDTDQSFGTVWKTDTGIAYDSQQALGEFDVRMETSALQKIYPQYQQEAAARWKQLRGTTLSENEILTRVDALYTSLSASGAMARDVSQWSNRFGGDDSVGALKDFVRARLAVLDAYYG